jgi:hypothetical protein
MMALHFLHQCPLSSQAVNTLSMGAENFLFRLTNAVDRYGCYDARIPLLRTELYPLKVDDITAEQVTDWLTECVNAGLIILYEAHGEPYLELQGYKCRSGKIKSIIPQRRPEPEPAEEALIETETTTETQPVQYVAYTPPTEKPKPEPGKEHDFFLNELFKREHAKYVDSLCHLIREPILERRWVEAFNQHIRSEGKRYTVDYEWLDRLRIWLPENIKRLLREENARATKYKQRPRPMVM